MKKITNIYRLDFNSFLIVAKYFFKRLFKISISQNEKNFYSIYNSLIIYDGKIVESNHEYIVISLKINPKKIKLRVNDSSDFLVFNQIFRQKEYLQLVNTYKKYHDTNKTINIIDAGSNIGLTSLFFLDNFKKVKIVCLEPEKENFEILRYNLSNIRNSEIILENCALWSSNTNIKILNDFGDLLNWSFRVEKSNNPDDIKAYSLITLMNNYDFNLIDILKIDIEGSEKEIFTSENADVSFLEKTKCIAIEIHDEFDCREDIVRILEKYNFQWFNSGELTIGINQNLVNN